jgi:hypothetical protein
MRSASRPVYTKAARPNHLLERALVAVAMICLHLVLAKLLVTA